MNVNKLVKKWGDSHVIVLGKDERNILGGIEVGDVVSIIKINKDDKNIIISEEETNIEFKQ